MALPPPEKHPSMSRAFKETKTILPTATRRLQARGVKVSRGRRPRSVGATLPRTGSRVPQPKKEPAAEHRRPPVGALLLREPAATANPRKPPQSVGTTSLRTQAVTKLEVHHPRAAVGTLFLRRSEETLTTKHSSKVAQANRHTTERTQRGQRYSRLKSGLPFLTNSENKWRRLANSRWYLRRIGSHRHLRSRQRTPLRRQVSHVQ